jgi:WD40 repeat protein
VIVSGSMDGTLRFWDTMGQRLIKQIKVSTTGHPTCIAFNPKDICVAVGLSNKCVKYYELENFRMVSSTTIDTQAPRAMQFNTSGDACFVAYDDCTKVYQLETDSGKPLLLDVV